MNAFQFQEFLSAHAACDPGGKYGGLQALAVEASKALPNAEWEIAICGAKRATLRVAIHPRGDLAAARSALAALWKLSPSAIPLKPANNRPWVDARWDSQRGRWSAIAVARRNINSRPFSIDLFEEPIASALARFSVLAPISTVQTADGSVGWTLILQKPLPWPLFLRTDISAAFTVQAAQLSLLARDARIVALDYLDDALWARFVG